MNRLINLIVENRLAGHEGMYKKVTIAAPDPRRLSSVIVPLPPPPSAK